MTQEQSKPGESARCCGAGCCGEPAGAETGKRQVVIDFLYLDLEVCSWCKGTGDSLETALSQVATVFQAGGVEVAVNRIHVDSEEKALQHRFSSSPTIRVNGRDIQLEGKESKCESCGDLCGDEVDCRIWLYQGKEYTSPPPAMIIGFFADLRRAMAVASSVSSGRMRRGVHTFSSNRLSGQS